jgi:MinD-like ATPase involved in chromosome partitioning or flagellar assembly
VVASQVYHWEGIANEMITLMKSGTLGGKSFKASLENGGEVIEFNPDSTVAKQAEELAGKTIEDIKDGTITITLP